MKLPSSLARHSNDRDAVKGVHVYSVNAADAFKKFRAILVFRKLSDTIKIRLCKFDELRIVSFLTNDRPTSCQQSGG